MKQFVVITDTHFSAVSRVRNGDLLDDLCKKLQFTVDYCVKNVWVDQWKPGIMLNCHDNSCAHATDAARRKMLECGPSEAQRSYYATRKDMKWCHTPEARKKSAESRDYKEIHRKRAEYLRHHSRKCILIFKDGKEFVGTLSELTEVIFGDTSKQHKGIVSGYITAAYRDGVKVSPYYGCKFIRPDD